jgi:hypothetical protein
MARAQGAHIRTAGVQPAQILAGLVSVAFLIFGIVGLTMTGFTNFTGDHSVTLLGLSINPLYNVGFVVLGIIGVLLALGSGRARLFGWLSFVAFGVLFVWGLMINGTVSTNPVSAAGNPFSIDGPDNWVHLGLAVLGLLIAVLPARRTVLLPDDVDTTPDEPHARHDKGPAVTREERPPGLAH